MKIAVTGATGFLGRYVVDRLLAGGHACRCWYRPTSDRSQFSEDERVQWVLGSLDDPESAGRLIGGCDAVVHAALYRPGAGFRGAEGDVVTFVDRNVTGSLRLIEAAREHDVNRFVYVSSCAVHEVILDDRPLDEAHPLWPKTHYGAHKAAVEKFVHSYGLGVDADRPFTMTAVRPTGIYGVAHPVERSKWFPVVRAVVRGETVPCQGGGKEVHVADVAKAIDLLLTADGVKGQVYNCYDQYVSQWEVATLAKEISGSNATIVGEPAAPKHQIVTDKIRNLGMTFGGPPLLRETIEQLVRAARVVEAKA